MTNGIKTPKNINPRLAKEILILKIIILVAILIVPIAFMFIDMSRGIIIRQSLTRSYNSKSINTTGQGQNIDFQAAIPQNYLGDISQVSQEKIDTLFNNLK